MGLLFVACLCPAVRAKNSCCSVGRAPALALQRAGIDPHLMRFFIQLSSLLRCPRVASGVFYSVLQNRPNSRIGPPGQLLINLQEQGL